MNETIIRDYTRLTDAQLMSNVHRGYEDAITEARRRGWKVLLPGLHLALDGKYYALRQTIIAK